MAPLLLAPALVEAPAIALPGLPAVARAPPLSLPPPIPFAAPPAPPPAAAGAPPALTLPACAASPPDPPVPVVPALPPAVPPAVPLLPAAAAPPAPLPPVPAVLHCSTWGSTAPVLSRAQERNDVLGHEQCVRRTVIASNRREGVELGEAASALPGLALRLVSPECQSRIGRGRIRWEAQDIGPFLDGLGEVCVLDGRVRVAVEQLHARATPRISRV